MMSESLGVAELKRRFSAILSRIEVRGERFAVLKRGRTVAMIGPPGDEQPPALSSRPRRGLAAAVGAWEEYPDLDGLLSDLRAARAASPDRDVENLR
jgi:antitoxin (DNA-binding transcriptional repressor) of toxin-antitoxin stability system